MLISSPIDRQK